MEGIANMEGTAIMKGIANMEGIAQRISSLPLYSKSSWGRSLLDKYGHDTHVNASHHIQSVACAHEEIRLQRMAQRSYPRSYIPPEEWWGQLAMEIVDIHFTTSIDIHNFPTLQDVTTRHLREHGYSFGYFVPYYLPSRQSNERAQVVLYVAVMLELVLRGLPSLANLKGLHSGNNPPSKAETDALHLACQIESLVTSCYETIKPYYSKSRGINSSTFANTAIESAYEALTSYTRFLNAIRRIEGEGRATRIKKQKEEENRRKSYDTRMALHRAGLEKCRELERTYDAKAFIAITIQKLHRGRSARRCVQRYYNSRALCSAASSHAKSTSSTRPTPPPQSTQVETSASPIKTVSTHPFRHRGLHLPKRKRRQSQQVRQHNRRTRRRPPPRLRRGSIQPSPAPNSPPIIYAVDLERTTLAAVPTNTAASSSILSVNSPTSTTTDETSQHRDSTTPVLPMVFWAAQTQAALQSFTMGKCESTLSPYVPPNQAANNIRRWFRRIDQRILRCQLASYINRRRGTPFVIRKTVVPGQYKYRLIYKSWDFT